MKQHYCPHCHLVYKSQVCPSCGTRGRLSTPDDLIFFIAADYFTSARVEGYLNEEEIPYLKKGELGVGLTSRIGLSFEYQRFFIPLKAFIDYEDQLNTLKEVIEKPES